MDIYALASERPDVISQTHIRHFTNDNQTNKLLCWTWKTNLNTNERHKLSQRTLPAECNGYYMKV